MTIVDDIQALLDELHRVYNEIQQKRVQWENLQTVDLARAEYESLVAKEKGKLADLQKRKKALEAEKRVLVLAPELDRDDFEFRLGSGSVRMKHQPSRWHSSQMRSAEPPKVEANHLAKLVERHQLKKLVNRFRYSWQLDPAVLGQINRIADDIDRPLGEALVLLDWSVFADRSRTQESPEMHLARLSQWRGALVEYLSWLERDIGSLEMRFRGWLHVWELWRARDQSVQSLELWMTFITESCHAKQDEIVKLEREIVHLIEEITQLKGHRGSA